VISGAFFIRRQGRVADWPGRLNAHLAAHLANRHAQLDLLERVRNLLLGETGLLHRLIPRDPRGACGAKSLLYGGPVFWEWVKLQLSHRPD